ncbi:MAG: hypothetical protein WD906_09225 [Anaerolineales bacterium]
MNSRIDILTSIAFENHARILGEARIWQALGRGKVWQDVQVERRTETASRSSAGEARQSLARTRP